MSGHTPGPWRGIQPNGGTLALTIIGSEHRRVCHVASASEADERVILASPRILSALKLAAYCLKRERVSQDQMNEINAAIATAEGAP